MVDTASPDDAISSYVMQLAAAADYMLAAYPEIRKTNRADATIVSEQLQRVTALLLASSNGAVALPSSPCQRANGHVRGWDFTTWSLASDGSYRQGMFAGRLDDSDNPASIDDNVVTVPFKTLGQWLPAHDFRTLRDVIATILPDTPRRKIDYGRLERARRVLMQIPNASDEALNI